jgi:DNA-binding HxlR family transcriptional regulator
MRRTRFDDDHCPIARATDLLADWWTPLVLREAFTGTRRFADFEANLDIPKAVLSARLSRLCDEGVLRREPYQDNPVRHEYRLTDKGRALWDVLAAMWRWGTDWCWPAGEGPVIALESRATGQVVQPVVVDEATGERLDIRSIRIGRAPSRPNP